MPNIGPALEDLLKRAEVETPEALRAIGSREAWLRIRGIDPSARLHLLQAPAGAGPFTGAGAIIGAGTTPGAGAPGSPGAGKAP